MKLRIIILKKNTVKRTLLLSILMILTGISLLNPFTANATTMNCITLAKPLIYYLYPMSQNNEMFWLESNPKLGYATLQEWDRYLPKGTMVIGVPSNMVLASYGGLDRIGKYVQNKLKSGSQNGRYDKDVFKYRRTVTADSVIDEIEVEVGKHFKNNDNIENLISNVKKHLTTDAGQTKEIKDPVFPPKPKGIFDNNEQGNKVKTEMLGGSLLLGGLMLMGKVLIFAL